MEYPPKILAHRGFSADYPENTRIAFRKALELPIDGLEFDVRLTADEVPIVIHDSTLDRTTDGHGCIALMTYDHISVVNAANNRPELGRHKVPTLQEVLNDAYGMKPHGCYNIEIKVDDPDWEILVDKVVSVVQNHPLENKVIFSSFHHKAMEYLKSNHPKLKIGLLIEEEVAEPWYIAKQLDAYSVHVDYRFTSTETISFCHASNVRVAVWTVDDDKEIDRFNRMGTDFIISNVPNVAYRINEDLFTHKNNNDD